MVRYLILEFGISLIRRPTSPSDCPFHHKQQISWQNFRIFYRIELGMKTVVIPGHIVGEIQDTVAKRHTVS